MKLTRIIHPVGQGGFYSETLKSSNDEINVIYDCGGNNKTSIESYLKNYYPKDSYRIDAVFISHLHNDHINGLEYLLKNYYVKYLFLPQLTEGEILEILLYSIINFNDIPAIVLQLLNQDLFFPGSETRIIRIEHENGESSINEQISEDDINIKKHKKENTTIRCGTKIHFEEKWVFIPFNPPITCSSKEFCETIKKELDIKVFDLKELPYIIKMKGVDKCKKVYDRYFQNNHNAYSMTLYSGLAKPHKYYDDCVYLIKRIMRNCLNCTDIDRCLKLQEFCSHLFHHCNREYINCPPNPNCLYMGDFDTKKQMNNIAQFYGDYWKTTGTIQVPHHGSRDNYQPELYEYALKCFISVGERNRYHHPNIETLIGLEENNCQPVIVTERLSTMKTYHYSF